MSLTPFRNGISSFGMPVIGGKYLTTGDVYFVHHTGANSNVGTDGDHPFATFSYAYDQCSGDQHDFIFLMPGHREDISSTIALDTSNVCVVGLGNGSKRPTLTAKTTGSDNAFEVTAAGQYFENILFDDGSRASTAPEVYFDIQANGNDATFVNCRFIQKGSNTVAVTMCYNVEDPRFEGCEFIGTSAGPLYGIKGEGLIYRPVIKDCVFNYEDSAGVDAGSICFMSGATTGLLIQDCIFQGNADGEQVVAITDGNFDDGLMIGCRGKVADITDTILLSNELGVIDSYFTEAGTYNGPRHYSVNATVPSATPIA